MDLNKVNSSPQKEPRFFYGYTIVFTALIVLVLTYGIRTSFGVFFKPMEAEFNWSRTLISGASTLASIIQGLWGIYMGRLNDRRGSRWVITICCFLLGSGSLLMAFTESPWQFYVFYGLLIGLGMGGVYVSILSTTARWFFKRRGLMTGIVMAGIGIGTATVAPVADWLIAQYGWRLSCVILGGLILIVGISAAQLLRKDPGQMGLTAYGQTEVKQTASSFKVTGLSLKEAARTWQFLVVGVIFACLGYCTFVINVHLIPHVTDLGIAASTAAAILAVMGVVQSIGGIGFGLAADRIGNKKAMIISLIFVTLPIFCLASISSVINFYLAAIVVGAGIGGATALEAVLTAELFGMKSNGVILGALVFGFTIGAASGPVVTGYLYDTFENYNAAFLITAGIGIFSIILAVLLKPVVKNEGIV